MKMENEHDNIGKPKPYNNSHFDNMDIHYIYKNNKPCKTNKPNNHHHKHPLTHTTRSTLTHKPSSDYLTIPHHQITQSKTQGAVQPVEFNKTKSSIKCKLL